MTNGPQFPIYIPSKSRAEFMITSKVLTQLGLHHYIVVEPDQLAAYAEAVDRHALLSTLLPLDMDYKRQYELCDALGLSTSTGSGPARNFAWDHSIAGGHKWHWVMDDNIHAFVRLNLNEKVKVTTGAVFRAMEDFVLRYKNIAMAGPQYFMWAPSRRPWPPFVINTRIYSCNLIRNSVPFRWRGRYNEDTILSLDLLTAGWCTVQFNAFLQLKSPTQTIPGGNTTELYGEGTLPKSKMLAAVYPKLARVVWKFGRWHHYVDYSGFKKNRLIRRDDVVIEDKPNEYGMRLVQRERSGPPDQAQRRADR